MIKSLFISPHGNYRVNYMGIKILKDKFLSDVFLSEA